MRGRFESRVRHREVLPDWFEKPGEHKKAPARNDAEAKDEAVVLRETQELLDAFLSGENCEWMGNV